MKKTFTGLALGLACCAMLSACGSGNSTPDAPPPPPPPPPVSQNLIDRVETALALAEAKTDGIEPDSVDAAIVAEPEDSEPKSL